MSDQIKISLSTFVGIAMALIASVRSIPQLAATGWQMIIYMIISVVFFALPLALICGELGAMLPGEGGPQRWVCRGLSDKWGFVVAWLLWAQMFPGMVMVAAPLGPLFGNTISNIPLGNNHWFVMCSIIVIYWFVTLLNLKFDMAKIGGDIGTWLGIYIPVVFMLVLGLGAMIKTGIKPGMVLGTFHWQQLLPQGDSLQYVASIAFIFCGISTLGVYIPRIKNSTKNFAKGLMIALIAVVLMNIIDAFLMANVVTSSNIQLANISQPIVLFCEILGWPQWLNNVFSCMSFIGVLVALSGWVTGPSQTMIQVANEGLVPSSWRFYKHNDLGVSKPILIAQAGLITLFALLYALPDVNQIFMLMTNTTTMFYVVVYTLIAIAFIRLRYEAKELKRPYRIGKKGNGLAWMWAIFLWSGLIFIAVTAIAASSRASAVVMIVFTLIFAIFPLILHHFRRNRWALTAQKYLQNYAREHRVIPAVQLRPSLVRGMGDESDIVQDSMEPEDQLRS